ncbi:MAG: hypothetical protein AB7T49_04365 [Oligoflexales bacterium]
MAPGNDSLSKEAMERRTFLQILGVAGAGLVPFLSSCIAARDHSTSETSSLTVEERTKTLTALFDVLIPSQGEANPGAVESKAVDFFRSDALLRTGIGLGYIKDISNTPLATATSALLEGQVCLTLDLHAKRFGILKIFAGLSRTEQEQVVKDCFADPVFGPVMDLVRASAMFAYVGAIYNDKGLVAMGIPPYEDREGFWHNRGYDDFTYDKLPTVDGKTAWNIILD